MAYSVLIYNIWRVHHYTTLARLHTLTHTFFGIKNGKERQRTCSCKTLKWWVIKLESLWGCGWLLLRGDAFGSRAGDIPRVRREGTSL